ncbi:hypothetical protein GGF46_000367 [Coemansia sp. RSA 552]|nr:hypothetical protein GGF46_000367 [Coemansia sp. RSA 552]
MTVYIYVEAAESSDIENRLAGIGIYFGLGDQRNLSGRLPGLPQSRSRAEIDAIRKAIMRLDKHGFTATNGHVVIRTTSSQIVDKINILLQGEHDDDGPRVYTGREEAALLLDTVDKIRKSGFSIEFETITAGGRYPEQAMAAELAEKSAR